MSKKSNAVVDFKNETFDSKVKDLIKSMEDDLADLKKQNKFHSKIVETFINDPDKDIKECAQITANTISDTMELIKALTARLEKSKTLLQFLEGNLILDLDGFAMLMIDVLGSQMVNYIELKNEHIRVSKKWLKK